MDFCCGCEAVRPHLPWGLCPNACFASLPYNESVVLAQRAAEFKKSERSRADGLQLREGVLRSHTSLPGLVSLGVGLRGSSSCHPRSATPRVGFCLLTLYLVHLLNSLTSCPSFFVNSFEFSR